MSFDFASFAAFFQSFLQDLLPIDYGRMSIVVTDLTVIVVFFDTGIVIDTSCPVADREFAASLPCIIFEILTDCEQLYLSFFKEFFNSRASFLV